MTTEPEWEKVEGKARDYWKPVNKGEERIGKLLRAEAGEYKGKPTTQYVLMTSEGESYTPNHALLNAAMAVIKVGSRIKIIYQGTGESKKKGRAGAELYDVFVDKTTSPDQNQLGQEKPGEEKQVLSDEKKAVVKSLVEDLKFGKSFFPDGILPENIIHQAIQKQGYKKEVDINTFMRYLKDTGTIFPKGEGYGIA